MRLLTDFRRDLVLGARLLARYPGFSAVSIATLAIGIGGNTAVFTVLNTLLLSPPPVVEPARLARIHTGQGLASWLTYQDIRDRTDVFSDVAAYRLTSANLEAGGATVKLWGQVTSENFLTVLGVSAHPGTAYRAGDADAGTVVLAHHVWRQRFESDPQIVGRALRIGGRTLLVAGVMPRGFRGLAPPGIRLDFWMPFDPRRAGETLQNRLLSQFEIVGRLKPDVG